jgi:hypothetical protein
MDPSSKLTTLQRELLKVYALEPTEEELREVQAMLGRFFADRFVARVDQAAQVRGITEEELDQWLNDEQQ